VGRERTAPIRIRRGAARTPFDCCRTGRWPEIPNSTTSSAASGSLEPFVEQSPPPEMCPTASAIVTMGRGDVATRRGRHRALDDRSRKTHERLVPLYVPAGFEQNDALGSSPSGDTTWAAMEPDRVFDGPGRTSPSGANSRSSTSPSFRRRRRRAREHISRRTATGTIVKPAGRTLSRGAVASEGLLTPAAAAADAGDELAEHGQRRIQIGVRQRALRMNITGPRLSASRMALESRPSRS